MRRTVLFAALALLAALPGSALAQARPSVIPLPNGWQPEGIAAGPGGVLFSGSLATGSILSASTRTGAITPVVPAQQGRVAVGLKYARGKLFVAGGNGKAAYVYDARTGAPVRDYALNGGFVNDVVVSRGAAYFTDSNVARLYVVPVARDGTPGGVRTLPYSGDIQYDPQAFNANGITATKDGRWLIVVQTGKGKLFRVDPRTGVTREIDLGGASVPNGDGILLRDRTLYVVQNRLNRIAVIKLRANLRRGRITKTLTSPRFQVPTTIAWRAGHLWAVNARFGTTPGPDVTYDIVRVRP